MTIRYAGRQKPGSSTPELPITNSRPDQNAYLRSGAVVPTNKPGVYDAKGQPTGDMQKLGAYLQYSPRTVRFWFTNAAGGGCLLVSYDGTAIVEKARAPFTPDTENFTKSGDRQRDRMVLAAILQTGGLYRDQLYTGTEYSYTEPYDNLCDALRYVSEVLGGQHDASTGFRMSHAWYSITCTRLVDLTWQIEILYNGVDDADEAYNTSEVSPDAP